MSENLPVQSPSVGQYDETLDIWDRSDPRSIINLLPPEVANRIEETYQKKPHYFQLDEHELTKTLRADAKHINATDNRIRLKFWMEYDICKEQNTKSMVMSRVISGICTREFFYKYYLRDPSRVAWLLCPPVNYIVKANEALEYGLEQMRDLLGLSHLDAKGKLDLGLARIKITIFKLLDDRIKGSVIQRTENKTVSLSFSNQDKNLLLEQMQTIPQEHLQQKIKQLEYEERKALHLPEPDEKEIVPVPTVVHE